jgi:hypothetical protein
LPIRLSEVVERLIYKETDLTLQIWDRPVSSQDNRNTQKTDLTWMPPVEFEPTTLEWPSHSLGGQSLASHRGGRGSRPSQVTWDLWWTKYFDFTCQSPFHSTFTIICHLGLVEEASSGRSTRCTHSHPTKKEKNMALVFQQSKILHVLDRAATVNCPVLV